MNWEDFAINIGVSALLIAVKNAKKRVQMRAIFLKVFTAIRSAYAGDPDFA